MPQGWHGFPLAAAILFAAAQLSATTKSNAEPAGETRASNAVHNQEVTALHLRFNDDDDIQIIKSDPGLKIGSKHGRFRIQGRTQESKWDGGGFIAQFKDPGGELEISCNYRMADTGSWGILVFTAVTDAGSLQPVFKWGNGDERFSIQTDAMLAGHELKIHPDKDWPAAPWGSDPKTFHNLKIHIHPERDTVDFIADEHLIETMVLNGKIGKVTSFSFMLKTPVQDAHFHVRLDDLVVRHPPQRPAEGAKKSE